MVRRGDRARGLFTRPATARSCRARRSSGRRADVRFTSRGRCTRRRRRLGGGRVRRCGRCASGGCVRVSAALLRQRRRRLRWRWSDPVLLHGSDPASRFAARRGLQRCRSQHLPRRAGALRWRRQQLRRRRERSNSRAARATRVAARRHTHQLRDGRGAPRPMGHRGVGIPSALRVSWTRIDRAVSERRHVDLPGLPRTQRGRVRVLDRSRRRGRTIDAVPVRRVRFTRTRRAARRWRPTRAFVLRQRPLCALPGGRAAGVRRSMLRRSASQRWGLPRTP